MFNTHMLLRCPWVSFSKDKSTNNTKCHSKYDYTVLRKQGLVLRPLQHVRSSSLIFLNKHKPVLLFWLNLMKCCLRHISPQTLKEKYEIIFLRSVRFLCIVTLWKLGTFSLPILITAMPKTHECYVKLA